MIAALMLAGVCLESVDFGSDRLPACIVDAQTGETLNAPCHAGCTPARALIECGCDEDLSWDPVEISEAGTPLEVTRYEIERETVSTGVRVVVGANDRQTWVDEDDVTFTRIATSWSFARDVPFPREGTWYRYRVLACAGPKCGEFSPPMEYVTAPYACHDDAGEGPCYVGDPVVDR